MHYFISDQGGWMSVSGDIDVLSIVPDGYRQVDEAEFNEAAGIVTVPPPPPPAAGEQDG